MKFLNSIICFLFLTLFANSVNAQKLEQIGAEPHGPQLSNHVEPYDWGVIYYMSYDNNLEVFGKGIINAIRNGVKSPRTIAAIQADFSDAGGMHRYTIKSSGVSEERVTSDDSADEEQFIAYLNWFVKNYPSKRYIIIFLNHGGGIDEMCLDENPDTKGKRWMSGHILGEKLRHFRKKILGIWELLFLQQCGRGSLENLYSFRATANFIMSSPVNVGAPNTYYTAFHQWLAENPDATGSEVAAKISVEDRHYTIYTCLRTAKLAELPGRLNAAIEPLLRVKSLVMPRHKSAIYSASGEATYNAKHLLEQLAVTNQIESSSVLSFFKWAREDLFTNVWFRNGRGDSEFVGLSIFQPETEDELLRHDNLGLYKESKLIDLWKLALRSR